MRSDSFLPYRLRYTWNSEMYSLLTIQLEAKSKITSRLQTKVKKPSFSKNAKKTGGNQVQKKNSQKKLQTQINKNKSVQDLKLKLDQENRKKKSLMNVSKKAQTEKPKTSLEKQIEMNRKQSNLKKMKSKFFKRKSKN